MLNILAVGALYAAPKILTHLYTGPSAADSNSRFYRIRTIISKGLHSAEDCFPPDKIRAFKEIVADNAWISYFVLFVIFKQPQIDPSRLIEGMTAFTFIGSFGVWAARLGLSAALSSVSPWASRYIAPGSLAANPPPDELVDDTDPAEADDPILKQFQCAISLATPRFPIVDPNGVTLYDTRNLSKWVSKNGTSPATRLPMDSRDSDKARSFILESFINHRRDFLRREKERNPTAANGEANTAQQTGNEAISPLYIQELKAVFLEKDIKNFHQIPEAFKAHMAFSKCPITKNPIRFFLTIQKSIPPNSCRELLSHQVRYEKSAILKWIKERPTEKPPKWTDNTPIDEQELVPDEYSQRMTDYELVMLLQEIHTDPLLKVFADLAKN